MADDRLRDHLRTALHHYVEVQQDRTRVESHPAAWRYLHEAPFATLVDSFIAILDDGVLTAQDIRMALRLAVKELAPPRRRKPPVGATP